MNALSGITSKVKTFIVGTGGVAKGDLVTWSAGTVIKAVAAISTAIITGIAQETALAGATVAVRFIEHGTEVEVDYTGTSKTSLVAADIGTAFDLSDAQTIDLDDTTDGFMVVVGYDNDIMKANCLISTPLMKF